MNTPTLKELALAYTRTWQEKLDNPDLKPLHVGYRHKRERIMSHWIDGAQYALELAVSTLEAKAVTQDSAPLDGWNNHYQGECFREAAESIRALLRDEAEK